MDIYDYLKKDHQKVSKLFELYQTAQTERNKLEIAEMLNQELLVHADAEAYIFYKALDLNRQAEDEISHSEEEHEEIKNKLSEIMAIKNINIELNVKMIELKELVDHHVKEEEGKIFRMAKKILSDEDALFLKEKMHDYKGQLLDRQNKIHKKTHEKEALELEF